MTLYLSPQQAAQFLNRAPQTLARWRSEGGGPAYRKPNGRVLYRLSDLEAFVEAQPFTSTAQYGTNDAPSGNSGRVV